MTVTVCSVSEKAYPMSSSIAHKAEPSQNAEIIHTIRLLSMYPQRSRCTSSTRRHASPTHHERLRLRSSRSDGRSTSPLRYVAFTYSLHRPRILTLLDCKSGRSCPGRTSDTHTHVCGVHECPCARLRHPCVPIPRSSHICAEGGPMARR